MRSFYFLCVIVFVCGQSPCPDVFEFKSDGSGVYGVIYVRPSGPVSTLTLRANFTIAARIPSNYAGRIQPLVESPTLLQDYNAGVPLHYRVDFPVTSPLPKVTAVTVNDQVLCVGPADYPGVNQYVATTSVQHTLYLKGGSPGFFPYNPQPQPQPQPKPDDFFNRFPVVGDTQIFTYGDDGTVWNTITIPSRQPAQKPMTRPPVPQTPPPFYPEVVTKPPPRQPDPYYPEVVTKPPPPQTPPPYYPEVVTQPPVKQPDYYPEVVTQAPRPPPPPRPVQQPQQPVLSSQECGMVAGGNERQPLIFNGQSYSRGDWPWLVAIYKRKDGSLTFICSGTLVSDRHVVTAAHCMQQKNSFSSIKDLVVKVGVYNLEDWGDDITITRTLVAATIHEGYNASSLVNDILVLTFSNTVQFNNNIRPACLWNGNADLSRIVGASGVVAGWGQSELGQAGRGEPRVVRIPVVSTAVCRASRPDFHKLTSSNTLCAGDRNGAGPCLGDSGGGLYLLEGGRWRLRGVVSLSLRPDNGDSTCNLNEYVVFTDSAKYLTWIQGIMHST